MFSPKPFSEKPFSFLEFTNKLFMFAVSITAILLSIVTRVGAVEHNSHDDDTRLDFQWEAAEGNVEHYNVYVSIDEDNYFLDGTTSEICYTLNGSDGHTYKLKVEAVDAAGNVGPMSEESDPVFCSLGTVEDWGTTTYASMFGIKNSLVALPVLRSYRDDILTMDTKGKRLVNELYSEHSGELSSILITHPKLARRSGSLLMRNLSGIRNVLKGKKMKITSSELAEVESLLDDVAEVSSREFARYIASVKQMLKENQLAKFGVFVQNPKETHLLQNNPNPCNPETWIPYQLKKDNEVKIQIYGLAGKLVRELNLGYKPAGIYVGRNRAAYWDGRNKFGTPVASGVYFYKIEAGDFSAIRRLVVLK